ncbi:SH3 domain-containing protein [Streptomyces triticagri]|uniref:SH3 domain-containing protein n=1 Tax=Streptomyces triticagri TaxID=2293568 RepID=UPI001F4784C0|nr:SH3 domain-containing protein [Streptomyces triticagri]
MNTDAAQTDEAAATAGDAEAKARSYPVAPGYRLNVRSGPGTNYRLVRVLPAGSSVRVYCQTRGQSVTGPYGTSNIWNNIANGQFVSDTYVKTGSDGFIAPPCA